MSKLYPVGFSSKSGMDDTSVVLTFNRDLTSEEYRSLSKHIAAWDGMKPLPDQNAAVPTDSQEQAVSATKGGK